MTDDTCWTVIHQAARGDSAARTRFASLYQDTLRAYLAARWGSGPLAQELDDAVQDVFVECFKDQGALERSDERRPGGFRAFLYGVARNVARRREQREAGQRRRQPDESAHVSRMASPDAALSRVFDRAWAQAVMREAASRMTARAKTLDATIDDGDGDARAGASADHDALRRVELLRLRFGEGRPIREIATAWDEDPARVHRAYARARDEFRAALAEVVAFHHPGSPAAVEAECAALLGLLGPG